MRGDTVAPLTCGSISDSDPITGLPANNYSFANYETIVGDYGGTVTFDYTLFAGKQFINPITFETYTFDNPSTVPTAASLGTMTVQADDGSISQVNWYVDNSATYPYLVTETIVNGNVESRGTHAIVGVGNGTLGATGAIYILMNFDESLNFSAEYPMVRASGTEGDIEGQSVIQQ